VISRYSFLLVSRHVQLAEGSNTITVTATDAGGSSTTSSITVNATTTLNYIRVTSDTESGIAPLEAALRVDGSFSITNTSIDASGPASPAITVIAPGEYKVKMVTEGMYTFTISSTGPDGNTYQDTVTITVLNRTEIDKLLKAKWEGMKTALSNNDINGASNFFAPETKQLYTDMFSALSSQLPQLVQDMQSIQLIYINNNSSIYRIRQSELYGGQIVTMTYHIYFGRDPGGLWKIYRF
jgi:hypothetical protein